MNSEKPDLQNQLSQAWAAEGAVIKRIIDICSVPNTSWIDESDERSRRTKSLTQAMTEWGHLQRASNTLSTAWQATSRELSESLRQARDSTVRMRKAALHAVREAEAQGRASRTHILKKMSEANQFQQMLGAYQRRK